MSSEGVSVGSRQVGKEKQIEAINSLTTALKVSGISRKQSGNGVMQRNGTRLTNGDPAPLMLWGEER